MQTGHKTGSKSEAQRRMHNCTEGDLQSKVRKSLSREKAPSDRMVSRGRQWRQLCTGTTVNMADHYLLNYQYFQSFGRADANEFEFPTSTVRSAPDVPLANYEQLRVL